MEDIMPYYKNLSLGDIEGEIWLPVIGWENLYHVSNLGRVKSLGRVTIWKQGPAKFRGRIMKQRVNKKGYLTVYFRYKERINNYSVHRLVAKSFIPNLENKPTVNHKFGNKLDNRANMLEWNTMSEQTQHAYDTGLIKDRNRPKPKGELSKFSKPVDQFSINGEYIKTFPSFSDIERELSFGSSNVNNAARKNLISYGFRWRYSKKTA